MKDNIIYLPIHLLVNTYWFPWQNMLLLFYFILLFFLKQGLDSLEFACIG